MFEINEQYLILVWVIALVIFTIFCIYRIYNTSHTRYSTTQNTNTRNTINNNNNQYNNQYNNQLTNKNAISKLQESYDNTSLRTPLSTFTNVATYINTLETTSKITDIPGCSNVYDDNIAVHSLGYNNCETAYSNYLSKNLDVNKKYGQTQSLADICPVSSKTAVYNNCLQMLMNKFTDNANMLDNISADMTSSINSRIQTRGSVLDKISYDMDDLVNNTDQINFRNYMQSSGSTAKYPSEVIGLVNNYYTNKYQDAAGVESFDGSSNSKKISTNILLKDIESVFFGSYTPIPGQFIAFNDLIITIGYDTQLDASLITESQRGIPSSANNIYLSISSNSNELQIVYIIAKIDSYKLVPNAIKIILSQKKLITPPSTSTSSNTIQNLLSILGITSPTQLIMIYDEFTSTENKIHKSYKLVNDNLDTIIVMNKL